MNKICLIIPPSPFLLDERVFMHIGILKVASSTQSCRGATLYVTLSPCRECSKLIHQSGIIRVVYSVEYKDTSGIEFLKKAGVKVDYLPI